MEKLIYLVWDRPSVANAALTELAVGSIAPRLLESGAQRLEVFVNDVGVAGPMPAPGDQLPVRMAFGLWLDCYDRRSEVEAVLAEAGVRRSGYLVTESAFTEYPTDASAGGRGRSPGERSPGVTTFSLVRKHPTLDDRTFREFWHGHQSPMSGEVQPRTRYLRHTVVHPVTAGALPYDGIVHESWPSVELLGDLVAFHNGDLENIRVMLDSVGQVFDLGALRSEAMSEYLLW